MSDGVPNVLSLSVTADVLGVSYETLRGQADRGHVACVQFTPRGKRWVRREEVERLARMLHVIPDFSHAL
ncbi:hypothetical protein [Deinococcus yavapaiensis]|uniref:Excisionase family DNA binding protein n=1 Tax=Deinococcus yavapaiensis KR-236 TaxID=694435 RepID=A0A318S589_9DEIO|nr:hypothetical protein [Deinococcus yavapaiensis]PYE48365.1 hypothetical protein DES52_1308 [Deinococcus yavapaiensis KR-236]